MSHLAMLALRAATPHLARAAARPGLHASRPAVL